MNKAERKKYMKEYYQEHADEIKAEQKEYRQEHADEIKAKQKEYYQKRMKFKKLSLSQRQKIIRKRYNLN
jgi:hypothetical protein